MDTLNLKNIIEAALLAAGGPLTIAQIQALFGDNDPPERKEVKEVIKALQADYEDRGVEVIEVASGFRIQVRESMSPWLTKLWEDRPPRYSRALLETLAIVAYRQPVTRGDIEEIRGVSVTTNIIRTLLERNWIKVVGHRDVPGKPAMFSTTREFLDYFSLKKLDDLPPLAELAQLEPMGLQGVQLELGANPDEASPDDTADDTAADAEAPGDASIDDAAAGTDEDLSQEPDEGNDAKAQLAESFAEESAVEMLDEADEDVSDEEFAAAALLAESFQIESVKAESIKVESTQAESADENDTDVSGDDYDEGHDRPPGAVEPLVGLRKPGEEPPEPATVASLDDARAAAAEQGSEPETDFHESPAEVVPLKSS